jgi:hypothetical protein
LTFSIQASQDDYDKLKHQVQLLMVAMGIKSEDTEQILSTDTMDKVIAN